MKNQEIVVNNGSTAVADELVSVDILAHSFLPQLQRPAYEVPEAFYDVQRVVAGLQLATAEKQLHIIGITSAAPREGTSTIAASMATLMAANSTRREQAALLVDAQLRHPSLHKIFGVANDAGLFELLHGGASAETVFRNTPASSLQIITVGQGWQTPLAQINAERFRHFLSEAKSRFEFVLVDLPPVLYHADSVILSRLCDGVVLVVQASQTRREVAAEAKHLLQKAGANIVGAVLNRRKFFISPRLQRWC